jgi:hypothetical protein
MNIYGWLFLIISWGGIIGLNLYCFWRVFNEPTEDL